MTVEEINEMRPVERTFNVKDMTLRSDGSGRVVEAYAAVFNQKAEIWDRDGHYHENIDPVSFNRTLSHKGTNFGVLFNHGRTVDGEPNPAATMPIGVPLEIKTDERGVWTVTRYLDNPLADHVLDAIKQGAIKAQSFSGAFRRSQRSYPDGRGRAALPLITRKEVEMREYGPAVFAAYAGAEILGTRSADLFVRALLAVPAGDRVEWLQQFEGDPTLFGSGITDLGTPTGPAHRTDDARTHSRSKELSERIRMMRERMSPKE